MKRLKNALNSNDSQVNKIKFIKGEYPQVGQLLDKIAKRSRSGAPSLFRKGPLSEEHQIYQCLLTAILNQFNDNGGIKNSTGEPNQLYGIVTDSLNEAIESSRRHQLNYLDSKDQKEIKFQNQNGNKIAPENIENLKSKIRNGEIGTPQYFFLVKLAEEVMRTGSYRWSKDPSHNIDFNKF